MTSEETAQVQAYILGLQTTHNKAMFHQAKSRMFAQEERNKMEKAICEIMKLCNTQSELPPAQVATNVRQIVNYYCPDYDIPF